MSGSSAMFAVVVREAISKVAAPEVADRIEQAALQRGGCADLPADALVLGRFVAGPLCDTLTDYLGEDVAEAVKRDVGPILAHAASSAAASAETALSISGVEHTDQREAEPTPQPGGRRVLIADDDPQVLHALGRSLREQGLEVVIALDGYAALELCQSMRPDVVVADLHMPAISGRQLIQTLQHTMGHESPPVIIVTGNVFAPRNIDGAAEVLRKPLDIEELTTAIELAAWDHAAGI